MLLEEFVKPLGITQSGLAERLGISRVRLSEILREQRGVTPAYGSTTKKSFRDECRFLAGLTNEMGFVAGAAGN
jgi:addiction module HigA family antidote